jgi:phosphoesterase RecJ-like protein
MNYPESPLILEEIKKAKKILINCHPSPDGDSVGSALSLYEVLTKMGKEAEIVCPSDISKDLKFLTNSDKIKKVNFGSFNFEDYDLFVVLDTSDWKRVFNLPKEITIPDIFTIAIDHHHTNSKFGKINLIQNICSTAEILYQVYQDWEVEITDPIANDLLTGIITDTGVFQYPNVSFSTLETAGELMEKGANKNKIILNTFGTINFNEIKMIGEIIGKMVIEEKYRFVWSAIPYQTNLKYSKPANAKERVADLLLRKVENTDFGIVMVEQEGGIVSVSLRARTNFDTSQIAVKLGGGGHKAASGIKLFGLPFEEAVKKVLETAREYAKKHQEQN